MPVYRGLRSSIQEISLAAPDGRLVCRCVFPGGVWRTEGAPLSDALGDSLQCRPQLQIEGRAYAAHKRLLTDNFTVNQYEIGLAGPTGEKDISAVFPGEKGRREITYKGEKLILAKTGVFSAAHRLEKNGATLASLRDVTPFLTLGARREYEIEAAEGLEPLPLSFAFFLAILGI